MGHANFTIQLEMGAKAERFTPNLILKHANRHTTSNNSFLLHNSIYRRCEVGLGLFATILACPHHVPLRGNLEMPILRFCRFKALP